MGKCTAIARIIATLFLSCLLCSGCKKDATPLAADCPLPDGFSLPQKAVYSLGEATHGSSEFTLAKQNVFSYLVENHGVRAFCLETAFGDMLQINHMLNSENWNAETATKHLGYWVYQSEEMKNLLQWIYDYNRQIPDEDEKIRVYGFDCQDATSSCQWLMHFLEQTVPDVAKDYSASELFQLDAVGFAKITDCEPYIKTAKLLQQDLQNHADVIVSASSEKEIDVAMQAASTIQRALLLKQSSPEYGKAGNLKGMSEKEIEEYVAQMKFNMNMRDEYMAKEVSWIAEHEQKHYGKQSIFITGHNYHVSKVTFDLPFKDSKAKTMGWFLKEQYQDAYYTIGTDFGEGGFNAANPDGFFIRNKEFTLKKTLSLPQYFHLEEASAIFVDFSENVPFFDSVQKMHYIGAGFQKSMYDRISSYSVNVIPSEAYDGLLYFPVVHAFQKL